MLDNWLILDGWKLSTKGPKKLLTHASHLVIDVGNIYQFVSLLTWESPECGHQNYLKSQKKSRKIEVFKDCSLILQKHICLKKHQ